MAAQPGRRRRPHRLRPRRRRHRLPRRVPCSRRAPRGAERDRRACRRGRALGPRRRPQPLDRRDRRAGRQVHQRRGRPRGGRRHEPRLQRRHRLVPRGAGDRARSSTTSPSSGAGRRMRRAARPRPDVHGVRRRRRRRGAQRRLHARRHFRRPAALGGAQLPQPGHGPAGGCWAASSSRASRRPIPRWRGPSRPCSSARSTCRPTPGAMGAVGIALLAGEALTGTPPTAPLAPSSATSTSPRARGARRRPPRVPVQGPRLPQPVPSRARRDRRRRRAREDRQRRPVPQVRRRLGRGGEVPQGCAQPVPRAGRTAGDAAGRGAPAADAAEAAIPPGGAARESAVTAAAERVGALTIGLPYCHYLIDTCRSSTRCCAVSATRWTCCGRTPRRWPRATGAAPRRAPARRSRLLHGLAGADVDVFFAPLFVHLPLPNAGDVTYTCPMAQGAPDMTARALDVEGSRTRVLRPVLFDKEGDGFAAARTRRALRRAAEALAKAAGEAGGPAPSRSAPPTPRRSTASAASRTGCARSACARSPGRAQTTTR